MKAEKYIREKISEALGALTYDDPAPIDINLERPKQEDHGDFSSNVAMLLAKAAKKAPRAIAGEIVSHLELDDRYIEKVDIAGPGFINFYLGWDYYRDIVGEVLDSGEDYGRSDWGEGTGLQVEFISANPTGPLNIVSARAAAVGDVLVKLFNAVGYHAKSEYYINDAGRQVRLLGQSVSSHYMKLFGVDEPFPEEGYHGEYISDLAQEIRDEKGDLFVNMPESERYSALSQLALERMIQSQQSIIEEYRVHFDRWFRESELRDEDAQNEILDIYKKKDLSYEKDGAIWFKSTAFGDEKDRVLVTREGEPTYFLIDIAYHKNKYDRGFDILYNLLGPDHHGYIPRMKASLVALGYPEDSFRAAIIQQVNLLRAGEVIKMSKRAGKIIEMRELIDEVGVDAARFFFTNRKISSHLDFDIDLAKEQSDENPVYYLQYAHARICAILRFAAENKIDVNKKADLSYLVEKEEKDLIKGLSQFPEYVSMAARSVEPHFLPNYLQNLAALFHRFYHLHKVVSEDVERSQARLALVQSTQMVLQNGFKLLGISAPEKM
jgi:arginyl-tRNA synthetase